MWKYLILPLLLLAGCTSNFYHSTEGTSTILGIYLPEESCIKINMLSYLGGSKTCVREPSRIRHEYESSSTNSYFGVVKTVETRKGSIEVEPAGPAAEQAP